MYWLKVGLVVHLLLVAPHARAARLLTSATLPEEDDRLSVAKASGVGSCMQAPEVISPLWMRKYLPAGIVTFGSGNGVWLEKLPVEVAYCTDQLFEAMSAAVGLNSSMKSKQYVLPLAPPPPLHRLD